MSERAIEYDTLLRGRRRDARNRPCRGAITFAGPADVLAVGERIEESRAARVRAAVGLDLGAARVRVGDHGRDRAAQRRPGARDHGRHSRARAAVAVRARGERVRSGTLLAERGIALRTGAQAVAAHARACSSWSAEPRAGADRVDRAAAPGRSGHPGAAARRPRVHPGRRPRPRARRRRTSSPPATRRRSRSSRAGSRRSRPTPPPRRSPPTSALAIEPHAVPAGAARAAADRRRAAVPALEAHARRASRRTAARRAARRHRTSRAARCGGRPARSPAATSRRCWPPRARRCWRRRSCRTSTPAPRGDETAKTRASWRCSWPTRTRPWATTRRRCARSTPRRR